MLLPKTRDTDIILQDVGHELLIYDLKINKAYALNETLKIVYQSCDGETSSEDLKRRYRQLNDDVIKLAVNELGREDLFVEKIATVSRRRLLTRAVLATAVLPVITIIVAPTAAHAVSCLAAGATCNLNSATSCCSKSCLVNDGSPICAAVCLVDNSPCNLNTASACCSLNCAINNGNPICAPVCLPNGSPCELNTASACCSTNCAINGGRPICAARQ